MEKMEDHHGNEAFADFTWDVIHKYFQENSLVKHQIESFNDFVLRKIDEIIEGFNPIEIHHQYIPECEKFKYKLNVNITNPVLSKPIIYEKDGSTKIMTPNDARLRNFSYASPLNVDIEVHAQTFDEETGEYSLDIKKINNINLGKIPIMVNSRYCVLNSHPDCANINQCRYDVGGYFVINGNEKVVVSQDRICENKTHVFTNTKQTAFSHIAEIRSVSENKFGVPKTTTLKMSAKSNQFGRYIRVNIHHIKHDLPLFILFRALGVESDRSILEFIVFDTGDPKNEVIMRELVGTMDEATGILSSRDALEYMSKYLQINGYPREMLQNKGQRLEIIRTILQKEFLPHVGPDFRKKALYLGYMVNKLVHCYLGLWELDDRDSYINKRVDSPGVLMANLFRQYFGKMVKDMKNMVSKEINSGSWKAMGKFSGVINKVNIYKIIKNTVIESGMKFALATGNWGIKSNKNKQGVAQVLNRMTYNATLSHLRRINTPIEKTGKLVQPRKLHSTQWGYVCPAETPEGASVGLVKNMSMTTNISIASNSFNVRCVLGDSGLEEFEGTNVAIFAKQATKIIVNGDILGVHEDPVALFATLKTLKRQGIINVHTGLCWNVQKNEINIITEGGRCVRPFYVVQDNTLTALQHRQEPLRRWRDYVLEGVVEYLDVEETNLSMTAMTLADLSKGDKGIHLQPNFTHMEIHPSLILGVLAGSIPFSDHNQAPRNCYQSLWKDEPVLMGDGTYKMIKDVCVGDEVVTFDNETMYPSVTKVINQYVRPTDNKIFKITTQSGGTIIATEEHKFMTSNGWQEVRDFTDNTCVGIQIHQKYVSTEVIEYDVLTQDKFINILGKSTIKTGAVTKYTRKLVEVGLLPLKSTDNRLHILARMAGFLMTDGGVYRNARGSLYTAAYFGTTLSADMFEDDIVRLGFDKARVTKTTGDYDGRPMYCYMTTHSAAIAALFYALGVSVGRKTETHHNAVPDWVMSGSKMVKREFLAGYQGGDGCRIQYNVLKPCGHNYVCAETSKQINPIHAKSLEVFMDQMKSLYDDLDIEAVRLAPRQISESRVLYAVKVRDTHDNLVKYFETVGYRYDYHKLIDSALVIEYLKHKKVMFNRHEKNVLKIRALHDDGRSAREIADEMGMNIDRARDYVRSYKTGRTISCPRWRGDTIENWVKKVSHKGLTLFIPLESVMEVENCEISDITTESANHSFIAGDHFTVHNSAMGKQAIGVYASNFRHRFDTMAHVLNYPQKPLVETKISKITNTDEMPCGTNAIVAIMTYTGLTKC
jgi:DNA-directed RNA polymerase beta subunit